MSSKYFSLVGTVILVFFVASFIYSLILIFAVAIENPVYFLIIVPFLLLDLLFGPALGLLFTSHARLMDRTAELDYITYHLRKSKVNLKGKTAQNGIDDSNEEKQETKELVQSFALEGPDTIKILGHSYSLSDISEADVVFKKVTFKTEGKFVEVKCNDVEEANKLYSLLIKKGKK